MGTSIALELDFSEADSEGLAPESEPLDVGGLDVLRQLDLERLLRVLPLVALRVRLHLLPVRQPILACRARRG